MTLSFLICKSSPHRTSIRIKWDNVCKTTILVPGIRWASRKCFPLCFLWKPCFGQKNIINLACPRSKLSPIINEWKAKEWSVYNYTYIRTFLRPVFIDTCLDLPWILYKILGSLEESLILLLTSFVIPFENLVHLVLS